MFNACLPQFPWLACSLLCIFAEYAPILGTARHQPQVYVRKDGIAVCHLFQVPLSPYLLTPLSHYLLTPLTHYLIHSLSRCAIHLSQPEPEHAASQDQPGPGSLNPYFKYAANLFENYGFVTVSTLALLAGACRPTVVSLIYGVLACCVAFLRKRTIFTGWRCIMIILALYVTLQYSFLLIGELTK